ncbi:MAG: choice-of-anchor D domain-containing protein [Akkermansiaceae bacterium]|nr:choice-of-anchor D domain-containing protein [Akkermansiaceae bacterium]
MNDFKPTPAPIVSNRRGGLAGCLLLLSLVPASASISLLTGDAANQVHGANSTLLDLSSDGNIVLFHSGPPAGAGAPGISQTGFYIRKRSTGTLTLASAVAISNRPEASISDDGRYLAWRDDQNMIYWKDTVANVTRLITTGADGTSHRPVISGDGRYVAYASFARNLAADSAMLQPSGRAAVLLYDSVNLSTIVASRNSAGGALDSGIGSVFAIQNAGDDFDFSIDGKSIVFSSDATNAHPGRSASFVGGFRCVYRRNLTTGFVDLVSRNQRSEVADGDFSSPRVSANGRRIGFFGASVTASGGPRMEINYSNPTGKDIYVKDISTGMAWWANRTVFREPPDGVLSSAFAFSGNGRTLAFGSTGTRYVDLNTDPKPGTTGINDLFRVDLGDGGSTKTTFVTSGVGGSGNVDYQVGPLLPGNADYTAFCTYQVNAMLGLGSADSPAFHGFAVSAPSLIPTPDISVVDATGAELRDGGPPLRFGVVSLSSAGVEKVFVIRNVGNAPLRPLVIQKKGRHPVDFTVTRLSRNSLAPSGGTSFKVSFKPLRTGPRKATISISSNDPDETPFVIQFGGVGTR